MKQIMVMIHVICITYFSYSIPSIPTITSSHLLPRKEVRKSIHLTMQTDLMQTTWNTPYFSSISTHFGIFGGNPQKVTPYYSVPQIQGGALYQRGFRKKSELSLYASILSPSYLNQGVGPQLVLTAAIKTRFLEKENITGSYTFATGLFYNARPGGFGIIRQTFALSSNTFPRIFTFAFSMQTGVGYERPFTGFNAPFIQRVLTLCMPEVEFIWHKEDGARFMYSYGLGLKFVMITDILPIFSGLLPYDYTWKESYSTGNCELSWNFAWSRKKINRHDR